MKSGSRIALVGVIGASLWLGACGHPGTAVTPKDIAVKDALGGPAVTCSADKPKAARPIVVDLDDGALADLESSMKAGVVVVSYDCATIKVLRNCVVTGEENAYEYGGVDPKEKIVSVTNQDELSVNVPVSSAKLGAEVKSGRNIDIAMIFRGQNTVSFDNVARTSLAPKGKDKTSCDGATHFIRQATMGAFAVVSGTEGRIGAAAEAFGVGASGSSDAKRKAVAKNGTLEACKGAAQDGEKPVEFCRAPLILELQPILGEAPKESSKDVKKDEVKPPEAEASPCPDGWVFAEGKCTKNKTVAFTCEPRDTEQCQAQCSKGSAESCFNLGATLYSKDKQKAYDAFKKGCDGDVPESCTYQASLIGLRDITTVPKDQADAERERVAKKACDGASAEGCRQLGNHFLHGTRDLKKARRAYRRACTFGSEIGCSDAADAFREKDESTEADYASALEYAKKGCSPESAAVMCMSLAQVLLDKRAPASVRNEAKGMSVMNGMMKDPDDGYLVLLLMGLGGDEGANLEPYILKTGEALCAKSPKHCDIAAGLYEIGAPGVTKNLQKAQALYKKSCDAGEDKSCEQADKLKAPTKKPPPKKPAKKK